MKYTFKGQAVNLNSDGSTGVLLFGDQSKIIINSFVLRSGKLLTVITGIN